MAQTLNEQLRTACLTSPVDYEKVENLLRDGADPIATIMVDGRTEVLYENLYMEFIDTPQLRTTMVKLTALFLRYGMDMDRPEVPYEEAQVIHPLWTFSFHSDGGGTLEILKLLLDHGLSASSAAQCWHHILLDDLNAYGELEDAFSYEMFYEDIRKILLIASYPHVLNADEQLKDVIWYAVNAYDVQKFRCWNDFTFQVDTSHCQNGPEIDRSVVTVVEKSTGHAVWTVGFGMEPADIHA